MVGWTLVFVEHLNQRSLTQGMRCWTEFLFSTYGWSLDKYRKVVLIRDVWVWACIESLWVKVKLLIC